MEILEFKPDAKGMGKLMGELEASIMELIWSNGKSSVRDVYESLLSNRKIAYTTVMTIMSRLQKKGYLTKEISGNSYLYQASMPKDEFEAMAMDKVLSGLVEGFGSKVIARLVDQSSKIDLDDASISELEKLIEEHKNKPKNV